jgi:hypothetical protein
MDSYVNAGAKRNREAVENVPCSAVRRLRDPSWSMYFAKCGQVVERWLPRKQRPWREKAAGLNALPSRLSQTSYQGSTVDLKRSMIMFPLVNEVETIGRMQSRCPTDARGMHRVSGPKNLKAS